MTKQNKFSKIALTAAVVGAAAVVAPVASQAEEVVEVTKVGFVVDGQTKIISADDYILAVMGAAPAILAEISQDGEAPVPALVQIGGKYVSPEAYITAYMSGNEVTADELTDVEEVSVEGATELVDGEWTEVPPVGEPTELTVEAVTAVNAKTLEVTFATAVEDTTKAVFAVKRGTANVSVTPEWSEDKKSVKLVAGANLLAGEHTVTVTGLTEAALTGKTTVEAVKATTLEIGTEVLTDNTAKAKLNVALKDQYGEVIKVTSALDFSISAYNTTQSTDVASLVSLDSTDGFVVNTTNGTPDQFKSGDKVTVTFLHKATGLKATKELTVSAEGVVNEITLGDVVLPTGKTLLTADLTGVKIPVTAKDQYGNAVTLTAGDLELSSNKTELLANGDVSLSSDGKFIEIAKFDRSKSGSVTINVFAKKSGTSANKTLDVQSAPGVVTTAELAETANTVAAGSTKKVKLTVKDNYDTELKFAQYTGSLSVTSSNESVIKNQLNETAPNAGYVTVNANGELEFKLASTAPEGATTTITVNTTAGKKLAEYVVTAGKAASNTSIDLDSKSKHSTKLAVGADTTVAFAVLDQYGTTTTLAGDHTIAYTLKGTEGVISTADVAGVATSVKVKAAKTGTATLVAQLKKGTEVVASKEVAFEVVANNAADVKVADIKDLAPTGNNTVLGAYKEEVKVETSTGAALPAASIISVTSTDANVFVKKHTDGKWYVQGVNATTAPAPADAKATLTVVYNADDKPVTLTKEVTVKTTALAAADIVVYNTAFTTSDTGKVTVPTTAIATDAVTIKGTDFTSTSSLYVGVLDNYGRIDEATTASGDTTEVEFTVSNASANITSADTITVSVAADGKLTINKNSATLTGTENGSFRILITTPNGRVKAVTVTVTP